MSYRHISKRRDVTSTFVHHHSNMISIVFLAEVSKDPILCVHVFVFTYILCKHFFYWFLKSIMHVWVYCVCICNYLHWGQIKNNNNWVGWSNFSLFVWLFFSEKKMLNNTNIYYRKVTKDFSLANTFGLMLFGYPLAGMILCRLQVI